MIGALVVHMHSICVAICRYQQLLQELSSTFPDLRSAQADVISVLFKHAAEATIVTFQNLLEGLCHSFQKQSAKRDAAAGMRHLYSDPNASCL